jgi:hypothetical protein
MRNAVSLTKACGNGRDPQATCFKKYNEQTTTASKMFLGQVEDFLLLWPE